MKPNLILLGGGGHCRACIDVIETEDRFKIAGILDSSESFGGNVSGYPIIGTDDLISSLVADNHFLVTLGQIKSPAHRIRLFKLLKSLGAKMASIFSPVAHISKRAFVGQGTIVMHHAVLNSGAIIGSNCIVNSGGIIEHDAEISNHCHISTSAVVNGTVHVGDSCFLGSSCVIHNNIHLVHDCVIGAGSIVRKNIFIPGIYAGDPLRKLETL